MKKLCIRNAILAAAVVIAVLPLPAESARARIPEKVKSPYMGALVVDAETGEVLFEEDADVACYPASIIKLMVFLVIQEKIDQGSLRLDDKVTATAEAAGMGGSQVYLAENEVFTIEELLYALMIQSANDASVALAVHVAGSKEAFVEMMQQRADELGMKGTEFHSVHGLPPNVGQKPDVSTPRDLAVLALELFKHPEVLKYTAEQVRTFRENPPFEMRSHNKLLESFEGCDGLKTGYFRAGGYSIAASAARNGTRIVAVVAGASEKKTRDNKAQELLAKAFSKTRSGSSSGSRPGVSAVPGETEEKPALQRPASGPSAGEPPAEPAPPPGKGTSGSLVRKIVLAVLFPAVAAVFFCLGRLSAGGTTTSSRFLFK